MPPLIRVRAAPGVRGDLRAGGDAATLAEPEDSAATLPGAIIGIYPRRIISSGIEPPGEGLGKRDVTPPITPTDGSRWET